MYPDSRFRMDDELLETFIRQYIESQHAPEVTFSWQAGEPGLNYLCAGYKAFFYHIDHPMIIMANLLRQHRPPAEITTVMTTGDFREHLI